MKLSSNEDYSKKVELFKKKGNNMKCFECNQKGTTYVCMSLGTFVCSECAGALRNLNYKVKGLGVTSFNKNEYEFIIKNGNDRAKSKWLAKFDPNKEKYPDNKNYLDIKKFIINKYQFQKYCNDDEDNLNNNNDNINQTNNNKSKINNENKNKKENNTNDFIFESNNKNKNNNNNHINDIFNFNNNNQNIQNIQNNNNQTNNFFNFQNISSYNNH